MTRFGRFHTCIIDREVNLEKQVVPLSLLDSAEVEMVVDATVTCCECGDMAEVDIIELTLRFAGGHCFPVPFHDIEERYLREAIALAAIDFVKGEGDG